MSSTNLVLSSKEGVFERNKLFFSCDEFIKLNKLNKDNIDDLFNFATTVEAENIKE